LIPSTFPANEAATFGSDTPLGRAGEPEEVAACLYFSLRTIPPTYPVKCSIRMAVAL